MSVLVYALAALAAFLFATAIYVLGQAVVGRFYDVKVEEAAVGFGPLLWQTHIGSIPFSLRAIPLGGSTRFHGDGEDILDDTDNDQTRLGAADADGLRFRDMPPLGRLFVFLLGPFSSLALGALCLGIAVLAEAPALRTVAHEEATIQPCSVGGLTVGDGPATWSTQWQLFADIAGNVAVRVVFFYPTEHYGGLFSFFITTGVVAAATDLGWFTCMGVLLAGIWLWNLLPMPSLNGFHLLCLLWEIVAGKPLSETVFRLLVYPGLLFLVVMGIRLLYIDFRWIWNFVF